MDELGMVRLELDVRLSLSEGGCEGWTCASTILLVYTF